MGEKCWLCEQDCWKSDEDVHSYAVTGLGFVSMACPSSMADVYKLESEVREENNEMQRELRPMSDAPMDGQEVLAEMSNGERRISWYSKMFETWKPCHEPIGWLPLPKDKPNANR